jgi:hypothetical protein
MKMMTAVVTLQVGGTMYLLTPEHLAEAFKAHREKQENPGIEALVRPGPGFKVTAAKEGRIYIDVDDVRWSLLISTVEPLRGAK